LWFAMLWRRERGDEWRGGGDEGDVVRRGDLVAIFIMPVSRSLAFGDSAFFR
jgi:hypothetical protein